MFIFYEDEDENDITRMVNLEEDGEIMVYPIADGFRQKCLKTFFLF